MKACLRILFAMGLAALGSMAWAKDYSDYRVTESTALDLVAGPANTAALLSPDGAWLLHVDTSGLCLLASEKDGTWSKVRCTDKKPDDWRGTPEDALWSPHGRRLVLPTFAASLIFFEDTDIRVLDPATMSISDLTDDGYDGGVFKSRAAAMLDLNGRWIDDETIIFLRYPIAQGGSAVGAQAQLLKINAAGGQPIVLATLPPSDAALPVYVLAVSADGSHFAYSYDDGHDPGRAGLYLFEPGAGTPRRIAAMADVGKPPLGMAYSADGAFLLLLGSSATGVGLEARVLELATGKIVPVDARRTVTGVAWSPTGATLAYVTGDRDNANDPAGLFLAPHPGAPARRLLKGLFMPPVCCGNLPFAWAVNDTMILGNVDNPQAPLFVRLGD